MAIALGSNLGDRRGNMEFGRSELARFLGRLRCSRIYETEPRDVRAQPRFLNACCTGRTRLSPENVLRRLQEIERAAGRPAHGQPKGPRVLDLDLLLYDDCVIDRPGLQIPHPRLRERPFVLVPLTEVAADWVHPEAELTVRQLATRISTEGIEDRGTWGDAIDR